MILIIVNVEFDDFESFSCAVVQAVGEVGSRCRVINIYIFSFIQFFLLTEPRYED